MDIKNTEHRYGLVAVLLHWVLAIAIIGMFAVGLYMVELDYYDPNRQFLPHVHRSVGVILALLFVARLLWKSINISPTQAEHKRWEKTLAKLTHALMYGFVFAIVATGYLISTADGRAVDVFDWFAIPAITTPIENMEDIAGELHYWLACSLIVFVMLHAAGALKHHFIDKDSTLKKMLGIKGK